MRNGYGYKSQTAIPKWWRQCVVSDKAAGTSVQGDGGISASYEASGTNKSSYAGIRFFDLAGGNTFTFEYWFMTGKIKSYTDYDGYSVNYSYSCAYDQPTEVNVFDPNGNLIYDVNYAYDMAGRLKDVCEPMLGTNNLIAGFEYDKNGNRSTLNYYRQGTKTGNTTSIAYSYNHDNMLTSFIIGGGPVFSLSNVTVDSLGKLKAASEIITKTDQTQIQHSYKNQYDMRSELKYAGMTNIAGVGILEWEPKDHENRVVLMSDETTQLLADMQVQSQEGHAYIFISPERLAWIMQHRKTDKPGSTSQTANNLIRSFNVICRRAGVKKCTLHDLRRSAITNWAQKLPIQVVQQLAGHSDVSTTRKYYLSVRSEDLVLAGKILNGILAGTQGD
jgi:hypothetical protein